VSACFFLIAPLFMLWSSKFGKMRVRDRLIAALALKGDEQVLDVGCGRGLALIGAAKKLTTGKAVGIDLWSAKDLSGNTPEKARANAVIEGVADRIEIVTGDMRAMPFEDARFDAIVSMTAIHNVPSRAARDKALAEIVRVLKPGGRIAIFDIMHPFHYLTVLRRLGMADVKGSGPVFLWGPVGRCFFARKPG
jgi:ubiquinone/menaquinone biosynthesis C-methylase UbiE